MNIPVFIKNNDVATGELNLLPWSKPLAKEHKKVVLTGPFASPQIK